MLLQYLHIFRILNRIAAIASRSRNNSGVHSDRPLTLYIQVHHRLELFELLTSENSQTARKTAKIFSFFPLVKTDGYNFYNAKHLNLTIFVSKTHPVVVYDVAMNSTTMQPEQVPSQSNIDVNQINSEEKLTSGAIERARRQSLRRQRIEAGPDIIHNNKKKYSGSTTQDWSEDVRSSDPTVRPPAEIKSLGDKVRWAVPRFNELIAENMQPMNENWKILFAGNWDLISNVFGQRTTTNDERITYHHALSELIELGVKFVPAKARGNAKSLLITGKKLQDLIWTAKSGEEYIRTAHKTKNFAFSQKKIKHQKFKKTSVPMYGGHRMVFNAAAATGATLPETKNKSLYQRFLIEELYSTEETKVHLSRSKKGDILYVNGPLDIEPVVPVLKRKSARGSRGHKLVGVYWPIQEQYEMFYENVKIEDTFISVTKLPKSFKEVRLAWEDEFAEYGEFKGRRKKKKLSVEEIKEEITKTFNYSTSFFEEDFSLSTESMNYMGRGIALDENADESTRILREIKKDPQTTFCFWHSKRVYRVGNGYCQLPEHQRLSFLYSQKDGGRAIEVDMSQSHPTLLTELIMSSGKKNNFQLRKLRKELRGYKGDLNGEGTLAKKNLKDLKRLEKKFNIDRHDLPFQLTQNDLYGVLQLAKNIDSYFSNKSRIKKCRKEGKKTGRIRSFVERKWAKRLLLFWLNAKKGGEFWMSFAGMTFKEVMPQAMSIMWIESKRNGGLGIYLMKKEAKLIQTVMSIYFLKKKSPIGQVFDSVLIFNPDHVEYVQSLFRKIGKELFDISIKTKVKVASPDSYPKPPPLPA